MNSRMDHPINHNTTIYDYDDDPHRHDQNVGIEIGHNEEQHGEKKSVLNKVKAKAKKIKDSIKEHVGHGHDHDEDEDEDDEMDMDPETHGAHRKESATRPHTHTSEPHFGERTTDERTRTKPSLYHTFDPTNATHTPGHEETLGWSTDTERSKEYNEQPYTPKNNTPAGMLSGGGHSTGDLDMGKKGPPVKLGTVGGPTGVEEERQVAEDVGADQGPVYQVRVIDPTGTGLHRTEKEEMIQSPRSKFQGDFQTFDPSTTRYVSGHEDSLDWSRTDTGRLHRLDDLTNESTNTAIAAQSEYDSKTAPGIHRSEVDKRTEREGIMHPPKSTFQGDFQTFDPSTTRHVPGHEDTLDWSRTDTGRPHKSEELSNVSKHTPITDHPAGQSFMPGQHRSTVGEITEREGAFHSPKSKFLDDFQTFNPSAPSHVSGQEETLGWSRTDTGIPNRSEEQSNESKYSPIAANSGHDSSVAHMPQSFMPGEHRSKLGERTAMEGALDDPEDLLQGDRLNFVHTTTSHVPGQEDNMNWFGSDTGTLNESEELSHASKNTPVAAHSGYDPTAAQGYISGVQRRSKLGEDTAMEGIINAPGSNLKGDSLTFVPTTTNYVPGQEETLGWSRTDTGRPNRLEELSNASKNTPIAAHAVRNHHMGADEERGTGNLGGLHENTGQILDTDPNSPRGQGERRRGIGGEDVGVAPIMHQLDKMNIYDEPHQNRTRRRRSPENKNIFTGSHDQFSPEPITSETNTLLQDTSLGSERSHNMSDQKEESYTEKISSTAAMVADKAKKATNSVASTLGYGDSSDQHSADVSSGMNEKSSEPMSYGGKISNVTSAISDKAVQAKDVVANKLGYGGNQEEQHHEKRDPVHGNVATVALKMQDSGTEPEVHSSSTTEVDKGVSMREYLAEKLRPGEEDKALSDVITGALPLHKHKEDVSKAGEEGKGDKVTIIGRVTESEEVARQFGRGEETDYDDAGTGMASPGKGVLDRLKDAASFWFQKGTEMPSQDEMVEGNKGSPVISGMESEQNKEQKEVGGSGLQN